MKHFLLLPLLFTFPPPAFAAPVAKPNVVVLIADDFNPFYTGFAGAINVTVLSGL